MLATLIAVSFVFKRLGADVLGVIYFVLTLSGVLCAGLEMGFCSTTTREVAAHIHDEPAYLDGLIRSASLFYWILYVVLAATLWMAAPALVNRWIHLDTLAPRAAIWAIRVLSVGALLGIPRAFYASLCRGVERMELNNGIDAVASTIQQAGAIAVIVSGGGLRPVVGWFAASSVLWTIAYVVAIASVFPPQALIPGWSTSAVRRTLRFSTNMAAISVLSVIHSEADKTIISKLMPVGELGYYGVAARITRRASAVTGAISQAAFPALSAQVHRDRAGAVKQYHRLQDLVCFSTIPVFAGVIFSAVPLLELMFSRPIALEMLLPVAFLALGQYMNCSLTIPYVFSLAVGKPEIARRLNLLALLVSLPFTLLLIERYGLAGAGFSWVVYHLFAYAYGLPRICRECLGITVSSWLRHAASVMTLAALCYGGAWAIVALRGELRTVPLTLAFCSGSLAYALGSYRLIGDELRRSLRGRIRALLPPRFLPALTGMF
jgi:O-antigen/teichoic acid export membrane protein